MMIYVFLFFSLMVLAAFIYDYSSEYVKDNCFDSIDKQEMVERFGEGSIVDDEEQEYLIFNADKAGPYLAAMFMTYYISYPVRWLIGLFG